MNWLEKKLKNSRNDIKAHKKEIDNLKDSNANLIFINEQLNKALKKSETRSEQLESKLRQITNETVILPKKKKEEDEDGQKPQDSQGKPMEMPFDGDVSSIMIRPDQIKEMFMDDGKEAP